MRLVSSTGLAALLSLLQPGAIAQSLAGTWQSKSGTVTTGASFYDSTTDSFTEPRLPGVAYSFTTDGRFESAAYIVTPNPTTPACASAVLQWQHGTYMLGTDGSLIMVPIAVDSRQLLSAPCGSGTNPKTYGKSILTRKSYNESMQSWSIAMDDYHQRYKLTLNREFGQPVQPLYYAAATPVMNPTTTLHPTARSTAGARARMKRALDDLDAATQIGVLKGMTGIDKAWWTALTGVCLGAVGVLVF